MCVCVSVCVSVCVCVCSLLRNCLNVFMPPLPKIGCPKLLEIRNPWGKENEISGLRCEHFCFKNGLKLPRQKKFFFLQIFLHLFTPFKRLYAPTFWSPMSKLFRFSESLGKTNWKKWSLIWILLLTKGVKLPRQKRFIFENFCLTFCWFFALFVCTKLSNRNVHCAKKLL